MMRVGNERGDMVDPAGGIPVMRTPRWRDSEACACGVACSAPPRGGGGVCAPKKPNRESVS